MSVGAVVVIQLVEQSLPTPEVCGLNADIGKTLSTNCTIQKTKVKKKTLGMAHLKNCQWNLVNPRENVRAI